MTLKIAVIYYCYNRIDHTLKSLPKILEHKNNLPLFIFSDGAKQSNENDVKQVRDFVSEAIKMLEDCTFIKRETNYGLAKNIIEGVNYVFDEGYDAVIVLEDDCVVHKQFFNYMSEGLRFYSNSSKVMHISGFGLPLKAKIEKDSYLTPYPCSWGWATWKENWKNCNFFDSDYYNTILTNSDIKHQFDWAGKSYSNFLDRQLKGELNSWLIRWYAHIFKNQGLCSWASNSLLTNIGFDGTGEHKVKLDRFNQKKNFNKDNFNFEDQIKIDLKTINHFKKFFMGPKVTDKISTVIYMLTGIILEKMEDLSDYYN